MGITYGTVNIVSISGVKSCEVIMYNQDGPSSFRSRSRATSSRQPCSPWSSRTSWWRSLWSTCGTRLVRYPLRAGCTRCLRRTSRTPGSARPRSSWSTNIADFLRRQRPHFNRLCLSSRKKFRHYSNEVMNSCLEYTCTGVEQRKRCSVTLLYDLLPYLSLLFYGRVAWLGRPQNADFPKVYFPVAIHRDAAG